LGVPSKSIDCGGGAVKKRVYIILKVVLLHSRALRCVGFLITGLGGDFISEKPFK